MKRSTPGIERAKISDQLVRELRGYLEEKNLQPGDRLPSQQELCRMFGVSCSTVREAVRCLEAEGLVTTWQGKGVFVNRISADAFVRSNLLPSLVQLEKQEVLDIIHVRRLIEVEAAGLAAERADQAHFRALNRLLRLTESSLSDPSRFSKWDMDFHLEIASASGNFMLPKLLTGIRSLFLKQQRAAIEIPSVAVKSAGFHRRIVDCILRRDVEAARNAMAEHLSDVEREIVERYYSRSESSDHSPVEGKNHSQK